jgi:hypothetical protein
LFANPLLLSGLLLISRLGIAPTRDGARLEIS